MKEFCYDQYCREAAGFSSASALIGLGVLFSSFIFYVFTLAPTVIWGDSASFAIQAVDLHLNIDADSHPLFIVLGKLFSFLPFEVAYSLNLLTAVTASMTVYVVYLIILELTGIKTPAIIGATCLALSHAFWSHAVIAEVYDLNAFFLMVIALILLRWQKEPKNNILLYLAAFFFGLGLCNHLVLALGIFGFLFLIIITDYRVFFTLKVLLTTVCSFLTGSLLLIYLSIQKLMVGKAVPVVIDGATGSHYKKSMLILSPDVFKDFLLYLSYLFYQFPLVGFVLGFIGTIALYKKKRATAIFLILLILVNMTFFLTFGPGTKSTSKYTFYISDYAIFSVLVGYGSFAVGRYFHNRGYSVNRVSAIGIILVILLPLLLYNITPYASKILKADLLHARTIPYRDNETYFLNPSKRGYTGAARYATEALSTARPKAIIIADYTPYTVLKYFQSIKGLRRDILVLNSGKIREAIPEKTVSQYYGKRDIYLADMERGRFYRLGPLKDEYDFLAEGVLYRVVKKHRI